MSATVMSGEPPAAALTVTCEPELATCECCRMTEECTPAYIARVRDRHGGRWVCGLCAAAVEDEIHRSASADLCISAEEAVQRHADFCETFRSSPPPQPAASAEHLIAAMRQLFRRSLDSPRSLPSSPRAGQKGRSAALPRSGSCFPSLAG